MVLLRLLTHALYAFSPAGSFEQYLFLLTVLCLALLAAYPMDTMLFMDFRRHHTGLWDSAANRLQVGQHPNAGDGQWGIAEEVC